jgi:hypothetical protein
LALPTSAIRISRPIRYRCEISAKPPVAARAAFEWSPRTTPCRSS